MVLAVPFVAIEDSVKFEGTKEETGSRVVLAVPFVVTKNPVGADDTEEETDGWLVLEVPFKVTENSAEAGDTEEETSTTGREVEVEELEEAKGVANVVLEDTQEILGLKCQWKDLLQSRSAATRVRKTTLAQKKV